MFSFIPSLQVFTVGESKVRFTELSRKDQEKKVKEKLAGYKGYTKRRDTQTEMRSETVCMRENPFYVNTVRSFRDRRFVNTYVT